ncbi:MAG TPA: ABC transporter permease subunit [Anaerolineales bacterium]|nr:ABC transporter permease subunit [Anaerolineales bacterium]
MSLFVIARLTFREASRRWILWVALAFGLLFLAVFAIGFNEFYKGVTRSADSMLLLQRSEMYNSMLMVGLYAVNFLSVMMAVLTSVDTLSGEIASGTVQTLVTKPLRRWEIVLGKWAGFAVMLILYLALMAGGVMLIVKGTAGYTPPNALRGLGLMIFNTLLLLSISFTGGASLSTLANGVLVFGLYGVAFIGGWIEQFGAFMNNPAAVNIGIVCSLIMPGESLWRRAAYEMQSPLVAALGVSPFTSSSVPSPIMLAYAGLYAAAALALALRQFQKRDL